MPERQFITQIPGVKIHEVYERSVIVLKGSVLRPPELRCPKCQSSRLRIKASQVRKLRHGLWGGRLVFLHLKVPKLLCRICARYFTLPIPGVLPKRRSTEQFRQEVFHLHQGGLTQKHLSRTHGIATATVERWYQDFVAYRVRELKKHQKREEAKRLIPQLLWHIEECRKSPLPRFQELARTLKRWLEPIARMWRFTKNNGITEGLHTKMEMLSRRAFGFRNFQNYRLRVIALCGWDGLFRR